MTLSSGSTAIRDFNQMAGGGTSAGTMLRSVTSVPPAPISVEAVERVLASATSPVKHDFSTETRIRPDRLPDHTLSHDRASQVADLPPLARSEPRTATFHALQEWEGHVVEIEAGEFVARLVDLTAGRAHESEEATIPLAEISERDASRMVVGSIFRWVIGYERSPEGTRRRVSQIVFRDLPRMTASDFSGGKAWADRISAALNP